jgi:hypothetical protein
MYHGRRPPPPINGAVARQIWTCDQTGGYDDGGELPGPDLGGEGGGGGLFNMSTAGLAWARGYSLL